MTNPEHVEVEVRTTQVWTPTFFVAVLVALGSIGGVYAKMISNDDTLSIELRQHRADIDKLEKRHENLRGDIRQDIQDLRKEVQNYRAEVLSSAASKGR